MSCSDFLEPLVSTALQDNWHRLVFWQQLSQFRKVFGLKMSIYRLNICLSVFCLCRSAPPAPLMRSPELHCEMRVSRGTLKTRHLPPNVKSVRWHWTVSETKTRHNHTISPPPQSIQLSLTIWEKMYKNVHPYRGFTTEATFSKLFCTFDLWTTGSRGHFWLKHRPLNPSSNFIEWKSESDVVTYAW